MQKIKTWHVNGFEFSKLDSTKLLFHYKLYLYNIKIDIWYISPALIYIPCSNAYHNIYV